MVDNAAVGKNALLEQSSPEAKRSIKRDRASLEAIVSAIRKSSAVIEFNMDGTILDANENFLQAMGYNLHEIKGKPRTIFLPETYRDSREYQEFWSKLKSGHSQSAEIKRLGKGGREVWLQALYNPILNGKGQPLKVIKLATEITQQKLMVADYSGQIEAIGKSTAVIEFNMDGTIRTANGRFLSAMAYSLEEIEGKHHSIFVEQSVWNSREYREFWQKLKQGQFQQGEFKRLGKNGRQVWIQASYNPILDLNGEPVKVVKYATDVTRQKVAAVDFEGQIVAIGKSTAVVEFNMDGTIQNANDRFLSAMGYKLDEVLGKHHSMFVEPSFSNSREYREFWEKLNQGGYQQAEFKRLGKNGREVWIQASYNPILDLNGKPFKVVKYATDVTEHIAAKTDLQRKVEVILDVVKAASQGDLTRDIPVSGTDAIGQMGEGLRVFFQSLRHSIQQIHKNAESVGASAERLMKLSNQMAGDASETSGQARDVSRTSGEVSSNVSVLAAGGEEMLTSIRHIAANSTESARVAKEAVSAAENAKRIVFELGDSTAKIGNVVKLITSVAQQTNLLALNATIEAARAGEAGKGFAVVAHEVKELAKQTARATDEIGLKIEAIQAGTKGAVHAISQIDSVIKEIDGISASIASSIEQQTVTTNQMRRSVNEAALGATGIANGISGVAKNALNTVSAASETQNAAKALAQMAAQLQSLVVQFRC